MKPFSREDKLVREVAAATQADCVFLAVRRVDDAERIVAVGLAGPLAPLDQLEGSWPATENDAVSAFGHHTLSDRSKICDGFLVPVLGSFGQAVGALGVLSSKPLSNLPEIKRTLRQHAPAAASTIEQSIIDGELQQLIAPHDEHDLEARLGPILTSITRIAQTPVAFVSQIVEGKELTARALLFLNRGEFTGPFEYSIEGGPCADVYSNSICFQARDVIELYPEFELLKQLKAVGYLGLPIEDAHGRTLGHVGIISDKPLPEDIFDLSRMRIFASLLGSEVGRAKADENRFKGVVEEQQAQRIESLGLLAGGVAHDFNNLLAAITTNAELALTAPGVSSEITGYLDAIKRSSSSASELSSELLAYTGRGEHCVEDLDLSSLLHELEPVFTSGPDPATLLRLNLKKGLPSIRVNRTQIGQLAMNIVLNGIESVDSKGGGLVNVSTMFITSTETRLKPNVGKAPPGHYVILEVADTGTGIEESLIPRVFDPFRSSKRHGRGLGLSIVHGIVKKHGAALFLESMEDSGTRIRVWFPCNKMQAEALASKKKASGDMQTILIVEDQELVMESTRRLCQQLGYFVLAAIDGAQAIEIFEHRADEIDLVLLDIKLPDIDGRAVLRAIRASSPDVPVLLTSGQLRETAMENITSADRVGFLRKPFRSVNLSDAIASLKAKIAP